MLDNNNLDNPIKLRNLTATCPWWPFSEWGTRWRIRAKQLPAIRVGGRYFVTERLLRAYLAEHVVQVDAINDNATKRTKRTKAGGR